MRPCGERKKLSGVEIKLLTVGVHLKLARYLRESVWRETVLSNCATLRHWAAANWSCRETGLPPPVISCRGNCDLGQPQGANGVSYRNCQLAPLA
jgi:hypothetical protein